jgi:hypothetical protein
MPKPSSKVRVSRPPPQLATLVSKPGGLLRDVAIARCERALEAHRAPAGDAMLALVCDLENLTEPPMTPTGLRYLLGVTNQLIALAGMFGMTAVEDAAKRLSDLAQAMRNRDDIPSSALTVHIRATRLLVTGKQTAAAIKQVLAELDSVRVYFRVGE